MPVLLKQHPNSKPDLHTRVVNRPFQHVTNVGRCARLGCVNIVKGHGRVVVLGLCVIGGSKTACEVVYSSKKIRARPFSFGRPKIRRRTASSGQQGPLKRWCPVALRITVSGREVFPTFAPPRWIEQCVRCWFVVLNKNIKINHIVLHAR
jgi:hypothetical protein